MDPALLKSAPQIGFSPMHATFYSRFRDGRHVPFGALGHSQVHATFYERLRKQGWTPYGGFGHSQVHNTAYERKIAERWVPYGDFVYKPVTEGDLEVLPGVEAAAYGQAAPDGYSFGNVLVAGVIGFLLGNMAGEQMERRWGARIARG